GSFGWVQTLLGVPIEAVAGTSDAGVLGAGHSNFIELAPFGAIVTKLNSDGTAGWTFVSGGEGVLSSGEGPPGQTLAARGTNFALAGFNDTSSGDFDPGAGVDMLSGTFMFLSRFSF